MINDVLKAIGQLKGGSKGASRTAIANWLIANCNKTAGGRFNGALRRALAAGLEKNLLRAGATSQRFKLGEAAAAYLKPKKAKKAKKVAKKSKKKKTTKKKAAKKTSKKKTAGKKKAPKKRTSKKKAAPKRKSAKKATKKSSSKKSEKN